jgi:menaquinone-dependent protoporphyrinogen oxidase
MKKSLLTYSTVDGQTELICRKIAGYYNIEDIDILPISSSINLNNYKAVVIGASIRYGKYRNEIYDFIESNLDSLNKLDNAFFSVNVVARKPEK